MKEQDSIISGIKDLYGKRDVKISRPAFAGEHHQVYIVETDTHKTVFRLSSKECALKNFEVSRVLKKYGIPVPEIYVCTINNGKYCEMYDYIEGKTLYERHQEGISEETIKKIYTQLCDICLRMSAIPVKEVRKLHLHTCKTDMFFKILNLSPSVIGHSDLNDKNILLDDNDNICAILDLDDINLKTFELFLLHLFDIAQEKGYGYTLESLPAFFDDKLNKYHTISLSKQYKIYKKIINFKSKILHAKQMLQTKLK
jgi:serine/threonine protein kinase